MARASHVPAFIISHAFIPVALRPSSSAATAGLLLRFVPMMLLDPAPG